jgi:hypothetical protein
MLGFQRPSPGSPDSVGSSGDWLLRERIAAFQAAACDDGRLEPPVAPSGLSSRPAHRRRNWCACPALAGPPVQASPALREFCFVMERDLINYIEQMPPGRRRALRMSCADRRRLGELAG